MNANLGWILSLKKEPNSRLDLSHIIPQNLVGLTEFQIAKLSIFDGNSKVNLGECFRIIRQKLEYPISLSDSKKMNISGPSLIFEGNLKKADYIGSNMSEGKIFVDGDVGDCLGFLFSGGYIEVKGSTGVHTACGMNGGILKVLKNVGDYGASALPGNLEGVSGGVLLIDGNVGKNFGNYMRRGLVIILGDAGRFLASRMVAGTIVLAGKANGLCGFGMKRGTIIFSSIKPEIPSTFVESNYNFDSYWGIISSDIKNYNNYFKEISKRRFSRVVGDLAFGGKGEWLY